MHNPQTTVTLHEKNRTPYLAVMTNFTVPFYWLELHCYIIVCMFIHYYRITQKLLHVT